MTRSPRRLMATALGLALVWGCACTCGSASPTGDARADVLPRDSSVDRGVDSRRDARADTGLPRDTRAFDLPPLPPCGGSRTLTPQPVVPYAAKACGVGCQQITFGRWVELNYAVRDQLLVYPSLYDGGFHLHLLRLDTLKEVVLRSPAKPGRTCGAVGTDGISVVYACVLYSQPVLESLPMRHAVAKVDPQTWLETDLHCQDIPQTEKPCLAYSIGVTGGTVGVSWNPGKCLTYVHTLPLQGGGLTPLNSGGAYWVSMAGQRMVWSSVASGKMQVILHDLASGTHAPIATSSVGQFQARTDGTQVVWVEGNDWIGAGRKDIYHYDIATKTVTRITNTTSVEYYPDVDGDWIVWEDWRNTPGGDPALDKSNADIYAYNIKTQKEYHLTGFPGLELFPRVDKGRVFFRMLDDKGAANLFMIDLATFLAAQG